MKKFSIVLETEYEKASPLTSLGLSQVFLETCFFVLLWVRVEGISH